MAAETGKQILHRKNGVTKEYSTKIPTQFSWHVNITIIDLSARNIDTLDEKIQFPTNLLELNLSHNKLLQVPAIVSKLNKLKNLDLSHNAIKYFDEIPNFCHTLERLDLSKNNLFRPPYWIWTERPVNLSRLNLGCNTMITKSSHSPELLQYKTLVLDVDLYNCGFKTKDAKLLATFPNAKTINFGTADYCYHGANIINKVPNIGLEKCKDIEKLNLSNTGIHTMSSSIDLLKSLRELYLACNSISGLPKEFCNLVNLETCVLSNNELLYLPDEMSNMKKLTRLCLDSNKLCMLPEKLLQLANLKALDLYDNNLYEILEEYAHLQEFDLALNFMDEPDGVDYLEKKEKLRLLQEKRCDGRKPEVIYPENEYSDREEDSEDEEYHRSLYSGDIPTQESPNPKNNQSRCSSSSEDWDSDAHWIPHDIKLVPRTSQGWIYFVKRKMEEGNFCPIDAHVVSVSEQVMYEKKLNPKVEVEYEGQFDDASSDES